MHIFLTFGLSLKYIKNFAMTFLYKFLSTISFFHTEICFLFFHFSPLLSLICQPALRRGVIGHWFTRHPRSFFSAM